MRLAACLVLALSVPPVAALADPAPLPAATAPKSDVQKMREKVICTKEYPVGSLIPVKRCITKEARDIETENARRILDQPIPGNGSN